MTKFVARYDAPFWRPEGLAGAAISHVGPLREIHDMSGPDGTPAALFGFAPTPGAHLRERALEQLARLFGPRASEPLEVHVQDWSTEPHTCPPEQQPNGDYRLFGHTSYQHPALAGRLHWAATETSTTSPGHVEGALQAAARATETVLDAIR